MAPLSFAVLRLPLLLALAVVIGVLTRDASALTRHDFPEGFVFGAGSSAFQVEGAAAEDGRKPCIWDTFTHADSPLLGPGLFLVSPKDGRGDINPKGLEYYNNLINELILHGIQPHATIYHFDLPQVLQDEYGGLLSPRFVEDYTAFAEACFKHFGDRVKHWVTVNEPNIGTIGGYDVGGQPPRRCSSAFGENCTGGNSSTEPYITAHHLLLAHASAVSLYRNKYKANQGGQIGITLLGWWHEPATNTSKDAAAAARMNDFHIGWFMHPLVYGDYPPVMRSRVGDRLPRLSVEESARVRGSFDFVGFNHYIVLRIRSAETDSGWKPRDYYVDAAVQYPLNQITEGTIESPPWALGKLLNHLKVKYENPPVIIHENGAAEVPDPPGAIVYDDEFRSEFLQMYLQVLYMSTRNGSDVRGYFVWSLLDVFEFLGGYRLRFGLCGVDMNAAGRTRYLRSSARWYAGFLHGGELRPPASRRPDDMSYAADE